MGEKRKLAQMLQRVAYSIEACGVYPPQQPLPSYDQLESVAVMEEPMPPQPTPPTIPQEVPASTPEVQYQPQENDAEIQDLRFKVQNILNQHAVRLDPSLVNEIVGLIEQHEVAEFPEHAAVEPAAHLEGKMESEVAPVAEAPIEDNNFDYEAEFEDWEM